MLINLKTLYFVSSQKPYITRLQAMYIIKIENTYNNNI